MRLSRRNVLAGTAGLGLLSAMPRAQAQADQRLTATSRILDVNGKPAKVFGLIGPDGRPGLTLKPGERFAVTLNNQSGTETIVHWHGQLPDWKQDGFPWPQTPAIANGVEKSYNFAPVPGTFWMHSHQGMQEQQLMAAPLIVHDAATEASDMQEVVMMLHDFSFKNPDELMGGLTKKGGMMSGGMGSMNMSGSNMSGSSMSGMNMGSMSMGSGGMMSGSDLNDIDYDAYLTNERTLADPQITRVAAGQNVRLRVINGASSTNFWIDLGAVSGRLIAVDGHDVKPVTGSQFPIAMAQRLDILLKLPGAGAYPIFAQVEGKTARTGLVLATPGANVSKQDDTAMVAANAADLSLETSLTATKPLMARNADITIPLRLGGDMSQYIWSLNGSTWPNADALMIKPGQRVVIDMTNHSMMSHPMHLHGHAFQVVAINGQALNGALRDTVLVPPMGNVRIAFDANNPGRWALHCHNLYHMMSGMMTEIRYANVV